MLHFEPVSQENLGDIQGLEVFPSQSGFIETVKECLAEAAEASQWRPVGIYDNDLLVGFAMYGYFKSPHPGRLWFDRLLIDKRYQGRGYGKAAALALLERLSREYDVPQVHLSVYEENRAAICLYRQIGFAFNGQLDSKGEKVMVYTFDPHPGHQ